MFTVHRGNHPVAIDEKNRMILPSVVRKNIKPEIDGDSLIIKRGENGKCWLYCKNFDSAMAARLESQFAPGPERQRFLETFFGMTDEVTWDKQGRMVLPQEFLDWAQIGKDAYLVGMMDHLELWKASEWLERKEANQREIGVIAASHRQALPAGQAMSLMGGGTAGGK